jgi:hypothetical protein
MLPNNDITTISLDRSSFDYWRGQVDTVLGNISRTMDEVNENLKSLNEWKGTIAGRIDQADLRITNHDRLIAEQAQAIKALAEQTQKVLSIVELSKSLESPQCKAEKTIENQDSEAEAPTFKWITEKFGVPILIAGISFFLFTIMPGVLVLLYILPKLIENPVP